MLPNDHKRKALKENITLKGEIITCIDKNMGQKKKWMTDFSV